MEEEILVIRMGTFEIMEEVEEKKKKKKGRSRRSIRDSSDTGSCERGVGVAWGCRNLILL
jgi:hypothetical protein